MSGRRALQQHAPLHYTVRYTLHAVHRAHASQDAHLVRHDLVHDGPDYQRQPAEEGLGRDLVKGLANPRKLAYLLSKVWLKVKRVSGRLSQVNAWAPSPGFKQARSGVRPASLRRWRRRR